MFGVDHNQKIIESSFFANKVSQEIWVYQGMLERFVIPHLQDIHSIKFAAR